MSPYNETVKITFASCRSSMNRRDDDRKTKLARRGPQDRVHGGGGEGALSEKKASSERVYTLA